MRIQVVLKKDFKPEAGRHALAVPVFQDAVLEAVGTAEAAALRPLVEEQVVRGKAEDVYFLPTPGDGYRGVLALGLGKRESFNAEALRRSAGKAAGTLRHHRVRALALDVTAAEALPVEAFVEGVMLSQYRFDKYKKANDEDAPVDVEELVILVKAEEKAEALRKSCERTALWTANANWARDLGNTAPNELTPATLADAAREMAGQVGAKCEVLDEAHLEREGLNALLAVAKGSDQRAVLIVLRYEYPEASTTLALVGKGVTFDTGGISIKQSHKMEEMKFDMCGAAAVLAAFKAVCEQKLPINVVCVVPSVENMPSGNSLKPSDIVKAYNGKTIEVDNTDAEGRLILCDALAYAVAQFKPDRIVDVATLTGGAVVALGHYAAGLMTNNEALCAALQRASDDTGERVWRLPLWEDYDRLIKGKFADLSNIGPSREASTIVGGCFLKQFVGSTPWAHLDIAGTAYGVKRISYLNPDYATGFGVRLLSQWIWNEAENSAKTNGSGNR
jgi:leucyl aminopeptidase